MITCKRIKRHCSVWHNMYIQSNFSISIQKLFSDTRRLEWIEHNDKHCIQTEHHIFTAWHTHSIGSILNSAFRRRFIHYYRLAIWFIWLWNLSDRIIPCLALKGFIRYSTYLECICTSADSILSSLIFCNSAFDGSMSSFTHKMIVIAVFVLYPII